MDPSDNNAGFELPSIPGQGVPNGEVPADSNQANPPGVVSTPPSPAAIPTPISPLPLAATPQASNDGPGANNISSGSNTPQFAQDKDLIDKEWVNKAKEIVEKNLSDPYKQSEALTLLKADYMKKRFNKTLKLSK